MGRTLFALLFISIYFFSVVLSLSLNKDNIFKRPVLENPTTLVLDDTKNIYWGKGPQADVIVVAKNNMTITKSVKIQNVRNVIVSGIHFTISDPVWGEDKMLHHSLRFQSVYGIAWVEGCLIDNTGGNLGEGINFWVNNNGEGALVVVNSRVSDIVSKPGDGGCGGKFEYDHYDLIQTSGGYLGLQNVTLRNSAYQGIMTNGQDGIYKGVYMQNVNLANIQAYSIFFYKLSTSSVIVQSLDSVYYNVTGACYSNGGQATMEYRLYPDASLSDGLFSTSDGILWNRTSYIANGNPPKGDFAPANKVGKNYDPSFFNPPASVIPGTGLYAQYYNGISFNTLVGAKIDTRVNFNWGSGGPSYPIGVSSNNFSIRWSGFILTQKTETHVFYVTSDDGSKLWINNELLIDNWNNSSSTKNVSITLNAGIKHAIKLEYYDNTGPAEIRLEWSSLSFSRRVIPSSQLYRFLKPNNGALSGNKTVINFISPSNYAIFHFKIRQYMASTGAGATTPRRSWVDVQKKTFSGWANNFLKERIMRIKDLDQDLRDGVLLCNLIEVISGKKIGKFNHAPKTRFQKIENISIGINFIQNQGIKLVAIGGEDITDGNMKLTLGLLWTLILRYQIATIDAAGYESPKAALLAWVRKRVAPYRVPVHDFDSSWQDGRALAALTDSMKVGILPLASLSNDPFTDANRAMDIAEENFGIPKILDPHDLVTIPDDLSIMTYLSYFRDYVANAEKKADEERLKLEEVRKRSADVTHVFARGSGIEKEGLYANLPASFDIQACNFYGEELRSGGEQFGVKVVGKEGNEVEAPVSDKGDGSYEVKYLPLVPDEYTIEVTLNGLHIQDSPFHVHIDGANPEFSSAEGPGITQGGSHVNKPAEFLITARDSKGQNLSHGGDVFTSTVVCLASGVSYPVQIDDNEDGTYTAIYQSEASGPHEVEVLLRGKPIAGAPHSTVVYAATPENSYAEGTGLEDGKADRKASFTVVAVDVDEKRQTTGGEPFKVILEGQTEASEQLEKIEIEGEVTDNNDGTYTVTYAAPEPGDYNVVTSLYEVPISGFPKQIHFKPSANGTKTEVKGTGIQNGVAERPVQLQILAKDKHGAPRSDGGDDFRVVFEVDDQKIDVDVLDNGDGTYSAEFVPTKPGDGKLSIVLDDGTHVAASPYDVYIKPLPSAKNTYAEGKGLTTPFDNAPAVFNIHAVDDLGRPIKEGGDSFLVSLLSPSGEPLPLPSIVDNSDGTYTVTYHPEHPGEYEMDIRVGEGERQQSIKNFPSKVNVREGTEGEVSKFLAFTFTVVAHDKRKQVKNFGGDPFEVVVTGPQEAKEMNAVDNGDGTYTGKYVLEQKGKYQVKVVLNGKEVEGSPFMQKVGEGKNDKSAPILSASARINYD